MPPVRLPDSWVEPDLACKGCGERPYVPGPEDWRLCATCVVKVAARAALYGLCRTCRLPRDVRSIRQEDGGLLIEMYCPAWR